MPIKPTDLAPWATSGTRQIAPTAKSDIGWVGQERPPAEYMNYLQGVAGDWIDFVNAWYSEVNQYMLPMCSGRPNQFNPSYEDGKWTISQTDEGVDFPLMLPIGPQNMGLQFARLTYEVISTPAPMDMELVSMDISGTETIVQSVGNPGSSTGPTNMTLPGVPLELSSNPALAYLIRVKGDSIGPFTGSAELYHLQTQVNRIGV